MSHRRHPPHHRCPACDRPVHGLTAEQVFDALIRRLSPGRVALRVRGLRRFARRIGTCDCDLPRRAWRPLSECLVGAIVRDQRQRVAA